MKKIINPYIGKKEYNCFGCCPTNPFGLHLEFFEDGDDIVTQWSPSANYQGWVNTLHGGLIATLMDEAAGWVITRKLQTSGVTSRIEINYKKPVFTTEKTVTVRAHITGNTRNYYNIHVTLQNETGVICDEADAVYYAMPPEKAKEMGFSECEVED